MPLHGWEDWPPQLDSLAPWGPYRIKLIRWKDGDTFVAAVNYGMRQSGEWDFRLARSLEDSPAQWLDTPELSKPAERHAALLAMAYATCICPPDTFLVAATRKDHQSFTRYIATATYFADAQLCTLLPLHPDPALVNLGQLMLDEQARTNNWGLPKHAKIP